ncbi:MAG TPA: sporulation protein YqfD [Paenibacillaceae bacterium]
MDGSWRLRAHGFVRVRLLGENESVQAVLREAAASGMPLYRVRAEPDEGLTFVLSVPDFLRLRRILRRHRCRVRIVAKGGFPFLWKRIMRRKALILGALLFVAALASASSLVWEVRVEPSEHISEDQIRAAAAAEGVRRFQWIARLDEPPDLARRIAARLPDAAWVGVDRQGTTITIKVVEARKPESRPLENPRDLVARTDAVITRIVAESGRPVVRRHDRVRKGDVLISGVIGTGERQQAVVAKGEVRGIVWHEYEIVSPLVRKAKTYTGNRKDRLYLVVGSRALRLSGYGGEPFAKSDIRAEYTPWRLLRWELPMGTMRERELEVAYEEVRITAAEAKEAGLARAREELLTRAGGDARILHEKILHEEAGNGKVKLKVLFEVDQPIAEERPIVWPSA